MRAHYDKRTKCVQYSRFEGDQEACGDHLQTGRLGDKTSEYGKIPRSDVDKHLRFNKHTCKATKTASALTGIMTIIRKVKGDSWLAIPNR